MTIRKLGRGLDVLIPQRMSAAGRGKEVITVPVEEGPPYTLGSFQVSGAEVFNAEGLTRAFEVQVGKTYNRKAIEDGMERVKEGYHNTGYVYAYTNEDINPNDHKHFRAVSDEHTDLHLQP